MVTFHGIEPNQSNETPEQKKTAVQSVPLSKSGKPLQLSRPNGFSPFPVSSIPKFNWLLAKDIAIKMQTRYLVDIVKDENSPDISTINRWMERYPKFSQWVSRSRMMFADYLAERSGQLFDEPAPTETVYTKSGSYERISMSGVQRERYKSQAMQWQAAKWNQDKYGDKLNVQNSLDLSIVLSTVNTKATPKALKNATKQVNQIIDAQVERKNDTTI